MRKLALVVVGILVIGLASCSKKPKDLIVGKWKPADEKQKMTIEFTKDGKMIMSGKEGGAELKFEGKYTFVDDNTIEVEIELLGQKKTQKLKIKSITKDEMETVEIDKDGKESNKSDKLKRI